MCTLLRKHACVSALLLFRKVLADPSSPSLLLSTCSLTFAVFTHHTQICQMHTCLSDPPAPAPSKVEAVFASRWTQPGPFDGDDQQSIDRGCHAPVKRGPPNLPPSHHSSSGPTSQQLLKHDTFLFLHFHSCLSTLLPSPFLLRPLEGLLDVK